MSLQLDQAALVTIAGKAFLILADTMPPPSEDCRYLVGWFYDAIQQAASNSTKVGTRSKG